VLWHGNSVKQYVQWWRKQRFASKGIELNQKVFCRSKQGNFIGTDEVLEF